MPTFTRRSTIAATPGEVFAYHARPGALERLVPPWRDVRVVSNDGHIGDGARVVMAMRLGGPVWRRWVAEHIGFVDGERFCDRQVSGPFKAWTHTHEVAAGDGAAGPTAEDRLADAIRPPTASRSTVGHAGAVATLTDRVEYELPLGFLGRAVGGGFVHRQLVRMFAFRHARTRDDLARQLAFADRPRLRVAVSGSGGLIGSTLVPFLTTAGHEVCRLVRASDDPMRAGPSPVRSGRGRLGSHLFADDIDWTPATGDVEEEKLAACDAVVHLAGRSIATRWTRRAKKAIDESRTVATRKLCETLARMPTRPGTLICASAVGYYGDRGDEVITETSEAGDGFAADVCKRWEAATQPAIDAGIRVVPIRIGVVLSARGGALRKLLAPARLGLAGRVGDGRQFVPWVAMDDLVGLMHEVLMRDDWPAGPTNAVTASLRQRDFIRTLGDVLDRPTALPLPGLMVKAMFGRMGTELLLGGQHVERSRLDVLGFAPRFETLGSALRFELGR